MPNIQGGGCRAFEAGRRGSRLALRLLGGREAGSKPQSQLELDTAIADRVAAEPLLSGAYAIGDGLLVTAEGGGGAGRVAFGGEVGRERLANQPRLGRFVLDPT